MESAEFSVDRQAILITALDYSNFSDQLPFFITTDVENQIVTTEIQVSLNLLTTDEAKRLINVLYSKISSFQSVSPCIQQSFKASHLRKFRDFVLHHSSHYNVPTTKSEYQAYFLKNGSGNRCSLYMLSVSVNEERGAIEVELLIKNLDNYQQGQTATPIDLTESGGRTPLIYVGPRFPPEIIKRKETEKITKLTLYICMIIFSLFSFIGLILLYHFFCYYMIRLVLFLNLVWYLIFLILPLILSYFMSGISPQSPETFLLQTTKSIGLKMILKETFSIGILFYCMLTPDWEYCSLLAIFRNVVLGFI